MFFRYVHLSVEQSVRSLDPVGLGFFEKQVEIWLTAFHIMGVAAENDFMTIGNDFFEELFLCVSFKRFVVELDNSVQRKDSLQLIL